MALTGAKALSKIDHPPLKRKPVLTAIQPFSGEIITEAVHNEIGRKGQVFYIHNRVHTIERRYTMLKKLFPHLTITIAHGQMPEQKLQKAMLDFTSQKSDILLCTTIIENGLDIPNANTIIIESAEHFGLSQIHQLRGRVGRSDPQGYAYILHSPFVSEIAERRLKAIKEYAALGSGYQIALKDLEIRGAGALLGHKQSGHVTSVGFEMYCKLLEEAVHKKEGRSTHATFRNSGGFTHGFFIPEDYISNERERLGIYQRLTHISDNLDIEMIEEELLDRYGKLPKQIEKLLQRLKVKHSPPPQFARSGQIEDPPLYKHRGGSIA
jgi:transcription-repair coupling factor (superfamily II helicase)